MLLNSGDRAALKEAVGDMMTSHRILMTMLNTEHSRQQPRFSTGAHPRRHAE
jgi:hypothetical protein